MAPKRGRSVAAPSLKALAIGYLSRREYSRVELRGRLASAVAAKARPLAASEPDGARGNASAEIHADPAALAVQTPEDASPDTVADPSADIDALLDWLEAHGYLSDARFVESRLHARSARHGMLRIRQELGRHGVELDADQAAALRATEFERAKVVWERKFGARAIDARGRAAQARFLSGRGFGADVVRRIVGGDHDE